MIMEICVIIFFDRINKIYMISGVWDGNEVEMKEGDSCRCVW